MPRLIQDQMVDASSSPRRYRHPTYYQLQEGQFTAAFHCNGMDFGCWPSEKRPHPGQLTRIGRNMKLIAAPCICSGSSGVCMRPCPDGGQAGVERSSRRVRCVHVHGERRWAVGRNSYIIGPDDQIAVTVYPEWSRALRNLYRPA